jgi:hypothetical protein
MSEDLYAPLLIRIAIALERVAAAAERPPSGAEAKHSRRKSSAEARNSTTMADTVPIGDLPRTPVNIDDDTAMRSHAGERIRQLVARASEAGCLTADIEEVITDHTGSTDPASLDLTTLSQLIVGLDRLIKSHDTAPEEPAANKLIRADVLEQIRTLTQRAAATDGGLATVTAIMRDHVEDGRDVDHLELAKLQALLAALQSRVDSVQNQTSVT